MPQHCRTAIAGILAMALGGLALPAPAEAQYFGRNQVQYESFDFEVLQTEHFDVHYYPGSARPPRPRPGWRNAGTIASAPCSGTGSPAGSR